MKPFANQCPSCKRPIDWEKEVWSISEVKGFKTKVHVCECGNKMATLVSITKETHEQWKKILG